jgi:hypothetical protein
MQGARRVQASNALDRAHWEVFCVSQTKLNNFCVIGSANWRATKCPLSIRNKRGMHKTQEEEER